MNSIAVLNFLKNQKHCQFKFFNLMYFFSRIVSKGYFNEIPTDLLNRN